MNTSSDLAIRSLIARYSDAVWRMDKAAYGACWAKNGNWRVMGQSIEGRDTIVAFWIDFMKNFAQAWQTAQSMIIEADEISGIGRLYVDEMVRMPDGSVMVSKGIYHDSYVVEDGAWVFT